MKRIFRHLDDIIVCWSLQCCCSSSFRSRCEALHRRWW